MLWDVNCFFLAALCLMAKAEKCYRCFIFSLSFCIFSHYFIHAKKKSLLKSHLFSYRLFQKGVTRHDKWIAMWVNHKQKVSQYINSEMLVLSCVVRVCAYEILGWKILFFFCVWIFLFNLHASACVCGFQGFFVWSFFWWIFSHQKKFLIKFVTHLFKNIILLV